MVIVRDGLAMRLGEDFHDVDDVRYLLRNLNLTDVNDALSIVTKYQHAADLSVRPRLTLDELLPA